MEKIIVGMSGGVDSAVASSILVEKGFDVEGLFIVRQDDGTLNAYASSGMNALGYLKRSY